MSLLISNGKGAQVGIVFLSLYCASVYCLRDYSGRFSEFISILYPSSFAILDPRNFVVVYPSNSWWSWWVIGRRLSFSEVTSIHYSSNLVMMVVLLEQMSTVSTRSFSQHFIQAFLWYFIQVVSWYFIQVIWWYFIQVSSWYFFQVISCYFIQVIWWCWVVVAIGRQVSSWNRFSYFVRNHSTWPMQFRNTFSK